MTAGRDGAWVAAILAHRTADPFDGGTAAALAIALQLACLLVVAALLRLAGAHRFDLHRSSRPADATPLFRGNLIRILYVSIVASLLLAPAAAMLASALDGSATPAGGLSTRGVTALITDAELGRACARSLRLAGTVVGLALPLGLAGALVLRHLSRRAAGLLVALLAIPALTPGLVVGLSVALAGRELGLSDGPSLTALAHAAVAAPLVALLLHARLATLDPGVESVARDLGASPGRVMRRILLPHLAPTAVVAAGLVALRAVTDHDIAFATGGSTLAVELAARATVDPTPVIDAAGATIIVATILLAAAVLRRAPASRRPLAGAGIDF